MKRHLNALLYAVDAILLLLGIFYFTWMDNQVAGTILILLATVSVSGSIVLGYLKKAYELEINNTNTDLEMEA